jgi:hypothetical protein
MARKEKKEWKKNFQIDIEGKTLLLLIKSENCCFLCFTSSPFCASRAPSCRTAFHRYARGAFLESN